MKRPRTSFTGHRSLELEKEFHTNRFFTRRRRWELGYQLNLTETHVKVWFQNRHMKLKNQQKLSLRQIACKAAATTQNTAHQQAPPPTSSTITIQFRRSLIRIIILCWRTLCTMPENYSDALTVTGDWIYMTNIICCLVMAYNGHFTDIQVMKKKAKWQKVHTGTSYFPIPALRGNITQQIFTFSRWR